MDLDRINELGFEKVSKWKTIVLVVSFSLWWNLLIVFQCYTIFLICSFMLAFKYHDVNLILLRYTIDLFYLFEVIFTVTYRQNLRFRKLRYSKPRGWLYIFIDMVSLVPMELAYEFHYMKDGKTSETAFWLIQNRLLRIYRLFQLESFYGIAVRKANQYVVFMFFQFMTKAILVAHVLTCIWVNLKQSVSCDKGRLTCFVWYETNMINLIILNWSGKKETLRESSERCVALAAIIFGFVLIFGYFYPYALFVSMQLNNRKAKYYDEYKKMRCYLNNMVQKPELKKEVLSFFNSSWQKDRDYMSSSRLFENIPISLQKELFTDIYWDAFRHSEIFSNISRNCKRSLSLTMTTGCYHSGETIYSKGQEKLKMMYLVQGIVQIMAEENEESPVLSLSSGTVFGELSLFLYCRSQAILKCKSYCELQMLDIKDATKVLKAYPKDKKMIWRSVNQRLMMARYTQWRKEKFGRDARLNFFEVNAAAVGAEDCVKWIKGQWRAVWQGHQRHKLVVRAKEEGFRLPSWHNPVRPNARIEFISNYLDIVVLSDVFEEKKDVVCLRTAFPWSLDPSTPFLKVWKSIILIAVLFPSLVYPFCTAWLDTFPSAVYVMSFFITGLFQIDVFLQLCTAVNTKHMIITEFPALLRRRTQDLTFYLDVFAALPYQLYFIFKGDVLTVKACIVGLILQPALLKSHVLFTLKVPLGPFMDLLIILKNCFVLFLLVYFLAEMIQLSKSDLYFFFNTNKSEAKNFSDNEKDHQSHKDYFVSVVRALEMAMSIPNYLLDSDDKDVLLSFCLAKIFFFFFLCYFFSDFYGAHTIKIFGEENFLILLKRIQKFLWSIYISRETAEALIQIVKLQWDYDRGDYLSSKVPICKAIPSNLRRKIYETTTYKTLSSCRLFYGEPIEFIKEVMDKSELVAVPQGSMLVTFGHTSHTISVLHRGFCQLNSFFVEDINAGLSRFMIMGPGEIFPILSPFANTPAAISVMSITDCELIMINLEILLNQMTTKLNFLKDVVETSKEISLSEKTRRVKPALVKVNIRNKPPKEDKELYKKGFRRLGICANFFYCCCPRRWFSMKFAKYWETVYSVYLTLLCLIWPCCFGLFLYASHILIPCLVIGKFCLYLHVAFQFLMPYYNSKGILITHPAYTSTNYLTTTFVLDFICLCPIYPIYIYFFADPYQKPKLYMVAINFAQHYLKLIHILAFMNNLKKVFGSQYIVRMSKILIMFFFTLNLFINLVMYLQSKWIFEGPYVVVGFEIEYYRPTHYQLIRKNNLVDYYMVVAYWVLCSLTTTDYLVGSSREVLIVSYSLSVIGTILHFYLFAWISSNSIFANIGGTMFQEKMTTFIEFLKLEKADDKLIDYAVYHYNNEWLQTQGENLKKIFENLPIHLHEELVYPLYRATFHKNYVFAQADEGFFKDLAVSVTNMFFNRGSVIIFQDESQSDIFFLHKGKCFVYDWFCVLDVGSIVGDIKRTGLMVNKVYALTHVEMLKISSNNFFRIINNFDDLEGYFLYKTKNLENFIKVLTPSDEYRIRLVDSRDVLNAFGLQNRDFTFEDESFFEDFENSSLKLLKTWKKRPEEKLRFLIIYPGTWKMKVYTAVHMCVTLLTLVCIPTLTFFGTLTPLAFIFVGILDILWFFVVLLSLRIGYTDKTKGGIITDFKFIAKRFVKKVDGLFTCLLTLLPFEYIPVIMAHSFQDADSTTVAWMRSLRILRGYYCFAILSNESQKLKGISNLKIFRVILILFVGYIFLVNSYIGLSTDPLIVDARNPHEFGSKQFFAFIFASEHMINFFASSNLFVFVPNTIIQVYYFNVIFLFSIYVKGWLISEVLSIFYVKNLATFYYKSQVLSLENYLQNRETSPSLVKEVLNYKLNLLMFSRSENMPSFLQKAPPSLRIPIMRDLYLRHLLNCPLFQEMERIFLEQLAARMNREVFFPGQKIVEQYDVDGRVYFIHTGEVYVIEHTKETAYVEFVVGRKSAGESFGDAQGLWFSLPHSQTYRARTLVELVILHSNDWADLRRSFPDIANKIYQKAKALRIL